MAKVILLATALSGLQIRVEAEWPSENQTQNKIQRKLFIQNIPNTLRIKKQRCVVFELGNVQFISLLYCQTIINNSIGIVSRTV